MSDYSDMDYSSDNDCEYEDYYNTGKYRKFSYRPEKKLRTTTNINHPNYQAVENPVFLSFDDDVLVMII